MKLNNKTILIIGISVVLLIGLIILITSNKEELNPVLVIENKVSTMTVGNNYQLNAYVENYQDAIINWDTSNKNILSIQKGLMVAVSPGTAIVTASYEHKDGVVYEEKFAVKVIDNGKGLSSIAFEYGDLIMGVNDTYDINSIIKKTPEDAKINESSYYSSNPSIVSVDDLGNIKCLNRGKSNILVRYNQYYSDTKDVYCINKNISAKLITNPKQIDVSNVEMKVNETKKLDYVLNPSTASRDYLTFSSSNSNIVSIDDSGFMTSIKEGEATIIVTSVNGVEGTAKVVVKTDTIPVTSISVSKDNIELKTGEKKEIGVTINPANATNKSIYAGSSNTNVAAVYMENNKVMVVGLNAGNTTVTIKCGNISKNVSVTVKSNTPTPKPGNPYQTPPIPVVITSPTITSTGTINSSLLSSGSNEGFNSCRKTSPYLTLKSNGTTIGQDGAVTMRVGQSIRLTVYLPTMCGDIITLTRTSPDGSSNWGNTVFQSNDPFVDRDDKSTYRSGVKTYQWTITALKTGSLILSQTAQFDVRSPSGATGNIKSMIRLHVKIVS